MIVRDAKTNALQISHHLIYLSLICDLHLVACECCIECRHRSEEVRWVCAKNTSCVLLASRDDVLIATAKPSTQLILQLLVGLLCSRELSKLIVVPLFSCAG